MKLSSFPPQFSSFIPISRHQAMEPLPRASVGDTVREACSTSGDGGGERYGAALDVACALLQRYEARTDSLTHTRTHAHALTNTHTHTH